MRAVLFIFQSRTVLGLSTSLLLLALSCLLCWAQSPTPSSISLPTELRTQNPGWWPTRGDPLRGEYVGPDACVDCHELKADSQEQSAMRHAATHAADSESLRAHERLTFEAGPYKYELVTNGEKSILTVSDGTSSLSADLLWAFGSGHMGQTYIYQRNGQIYESHVSFFNAIQALDITPGQSRSVPASLDEALGRGMPPDEAARCFGCHTTASRTKNEFDPQDPFPGVTCEACHGPGTKHVAAARAGTEKAGSGLTLNPDQFARVDSVDFCGACHRTWQDVVSAHLVSAGVFNVRFAPYRLENSRCWQEGDGRITCVACHDPHKPVSHDQGSYDGNCLQCHVATVSEKTTPNRPGAACPVATKNCVSCHMPKIEPPHLHSAFTDHWIRVARPGSEYPD
jgi:hypothetical protein